jgi:hypothetical protein
MDKNRNRWISSATEQWVVEGDGFICIFRRSKRPLGMQCHTTIAKRQPAAMLVMQNNIPMCFQYASAFDPLLSDDKVH